MAYTIFNTNGTILTTLADGQLDKSTTSLTLIGKNVASYGQELNNNFIKLLANSANSTGIPPRSPLTGQLWYDTSVGRLKVYDNGFKSIGAVQISASQPISLQTGDLWFDTNSNQLKLYSVGTLYTVGPSFPSSAGSTGLVLPNTSVTDQEDNAKNVLLIKSYGNTIGVLYYDETGENSSFEMDLVDLNANFPNASTSTIVSGLTIVGDVSLTGKISNDYLSLALAIDIITPSPNNEVLAFGGALGTASTALQNPIIADILNKVFPPNITTATTATTAMTGVFLGTQARVLCQHSIKGGVFDAGYQVRVFRTVGTQSTATWQPYYYTTSSLGFPINYII